MEQMKLFFNITNDIWKFAKSELTKTKSEMTDDDWDRVVISCDKICNKYEKLGEREMSLICSVAWAFINYIDREDKERILTKDNYYVWIKKN